jgi:hypothetical protein
MPTFKDRARLLYWRLRARTHFNRNDVHGALHRAWAYVHATQLSGDYYEFGVYRGHSLISSWLSYRRSNGRILNSKDLPYERKGSVADFMTYQSVFYGFDSFSGMPENDEGEDTLATGTFMATEQNTRELCAVAGLKAPRLRLVPGLFSDNAQAIGSAPAAIVHLDCDLYLSTRDALNMIAPRLVQGSVLLCDDHDLFRASNDKGQRRALREFLEQSQIELEPWFAYGAASRAYLCHVPNRDGQTAAR